MPRSTPGPSEDDLGDESDPAEDLPRAARKPGVTGGNLWATLALFALIAAVLVPALLLLGGGDDDAQPVDGPTGSETAETTTPSSGAPEPTGPPTEVPSDLPTLPEDMPSLPGDAPSGPFSEYPDLPSDFTVPTEMFPQFPSDLGSGFPE